MTLEEMRERWETVRPLTDYELNACSPSAGDTPCPFCGAKIVWCYPGVYAHCSRNPVGSIPCDCAWEGPISFKDGELVIENLKFFQAMEATKEAWQPLPTPDGRAWAKIWQTLVGGVPIVTCAICVHPQDDGSFRFVFGIRGATQNATSSIELTSQRGVTSLPALLVVLPSSEGVDELIRNCIDRGNQVNSWWMSRPSPQIAEA